VGCYLIQKAFSANWYDTPVLSGDEITPPMRGGGHIISWDTHVGKDPENTLVAPKAPTLGEVFRDGAYRSVTRLTITYDDIAGITYASQYDYTDLGTWRFCMSGQVDKGVEALARERRQEIFSPSS
jgi:hypothetical protein